MAKSPNSISRIFGRGRFNIFGCWRSTSVNTAATLLGGAPYSTPMKIRAIFFRVGFEKLRKVLDAKTALGM